MEDFFTLVGSFGFPISVATYLLFRFEKKLEDLAEANRKLCVEIEHLKEVVIVDLKSEIVDLKRTINKLKK